MRRVAWGVGEAVARTAADLVRVVKALFGAVGVGLAAVLHGVGRLLVWLELALDKAGDACAERAGH